MDDFLTYLRQRYGATSGTAHSYYMGIRILDEIFEQCDPLNLAGKSLASISDVGEIYAIYEFVKGEEKKMRSGNDSIFRYGKPNQTSYPEKGFCSAAVRSLFNYRESLIEEDATKLAKAASSTTNLISNLKRLTSMSDTESNAEVHQRIGQNVFRSVLLEIYNGKCCVCGLNIMELLRASHIIPWSENKEQRLNPENGLCLSATYDVAFDRNLISFDDDYKMVVSRYIKDFYTNEVAKEYFKKYEGKQLMMPNKFYPNKDLLRRHLNKLKS